MKPELERICHLSRLQLAITVADPRKVEEALDRCAASDAVRPDDVEESILIGIPFSGFPGAVEALKRWQARAGSASAPSNEAPPTPLEDPFGAVYGELAPRVRGELRGRHPLLERWIVDFAYGQVMGRGALSLRDVEAVGVAALLAQGRRAPLHSHLRGALRVGWTGPELRDLIEALAPWARPEDVAYARETVSRLLATGSTHPSRSSGREGSGS